MPLILNEAQTMLQDSVREFLADHAPVTQLRQLRDSADSVGFAPALWHRFAEMGYCGILVPEAHGGLGLGHVEAGVVMAQIGRQLCSSPLLASGIVATTALRQAGTEAQQRRWLPLLARGETLATLAVDEAAKHRPRQLVTAARADGEGWQIGGAKTLVLDGHVADLLIVAAQLRGAQDTAGERVDTGLFLLDPGTPGVTIERVQMVDAHNAARISFDGVRVPADALLGTAGLGAAALDAALNAGRAAAAAELLGVADEVFDRTVLYLKERRQFGKAIGEFQALQHRCAMLYCELELCRAALAHAQRALDTDIVNCGEAVALAKALAGKTATLAVQEGVQMHGGMGMTDEFDVGLFMKRARVLQELWGDANFQLDALARRRGY